ncbi:MAG TPA: TIGR00300 family protein [Caldilineae bacterium]|nr:TIGR00300 family protein [Caldilineae bacterium]
MVARQHRVSETIALKGHIIDSLILTRVMDSIMDLGGDFHVEEIRVGRHKQEPSYARLQVFADSEPQMRQILTTLQEFGAQIINGGDVRTEPAPIDGAAPEDFYSTTNLPTQVRLNGRWVDVEGTEMDLVIVVDREQGRAWTCPIADLKAGDQVAVGHEGIRVFPMEREREQEVFSFMRSTVSSERPNALAIAQIAQVMHQVREQGGRILFVVGPAIIHSGAGEYLARLIRDGYVHVLFGGNAIAVHDVESQLYGTSLGIDLKTGLPVPGGHRNHMRAINAIRRVGSMEKAVEVGLLRSGVMYEAIRHGVEVVLAGSIRDDGPMPGVITDVIEAQRRMRAALKGVEMAIMVATMLHSIATGNLLPAHVKVVVVDINPATVTKLADRGSFQAIGMVTDAELFLRELTEELELFQSRDQSRE